MIKVCSQAGIVVQYRITDNNSLEISIIPSDYIVNACRNKLHMHIIKERFVAYVIKVCYVVHLLVTCLIGLIVIDHFT